MSLISLKGKRILITSGPTWVLIDPMRVISNRATGELGQKLAQSLKNTGAKVTLLEGPVLKPLAQKGITVKKFQFYNELRDLLALELGEPYDVVIHNAAVSDFYLEKPLKDKISSKKRGLTLRLKPTEKLINLIKRVAPKTFLVGFKLEDFKDEEHVADEASKLFKAADCNLIVANTLNNGYHAYVVIPSGKILTLSHSRQELVKDLISAIKERA